MMAQTLTLQSTPVDTSEMALDLINLKEKVNQAIEDLLNSPNPKAAVDAALEEINRIADLYS